MIDMNGSAVSLSGGGDRLLAIGCLGQVVALGREPCRENVAIGFVVVDDENARWIVHGLAPDRRSRRVFPNFSKQRPRTERALPM
jgi:hypothetical protein